MSEEEKEAIEQLKNTNFDELEYLSNIKATEILLNYIDKLQKESEQLKVTRQMNTNLIETMKELQQENTELKMQLEIEKIDNKYNKEEASEEMISRYKIRDKIKELEEQNQDNLYNMYDNNCLENHTIKVLKDLLGE